MFTSSEGTLLNYGSDPKNEFVFSEKKEINKLIIEDVHNGVKCYVLDFAETLQKLNMDVNSTSIENWENVLLLYRQNSFFDRTFGEFYYSSVSGDAGS